jgi:outer membrane protein assembly factor BamD (BamD/ComL family)
MLDTVVFVDSPAVKFFNGEVLLVKVNAEEDSALAKAYSVVGYPTNVLVTPEGDEIDRIAGYRETDEFLQTIRDYERGIGTLDDLLARAETAADRGLYFDIGNKYKFRGKPDEAENWFRRVIEAGQPTDSMSGEARYAMATMYRRYDEYDRALEAFKEIQQDFRGTTLDEYSEIYIALVHRDKADTSKAIAAFKEFIERFPHSEDVEWAKNQIEQMKYPSQLSQ